MIFTRPSSRRWFLPVLFSVLGLVFIAFSFLIYDKFADELPFEKRTKKMALSLFPENAAHMQEWANRLLGPDLNALQPAAGATTPSSPSSSR